MDTPEPRTDWLLLARTIGAECERDVAERSRARTRPDAQCAGLIESHHVGEYVVVTVEDSEIIGYEVIDRDSELRYSIEDLEPRYTIVDWL